MSLAVVSNRWSTSWRSSRSISFERPKPTARMIAKISAAYHAVRRNRIERAKGRRAVSIAVGSRGAPQDVANAANRLDQARFAARLEFPAQVADEDLQHVGVAVEIGTPDPIHDLRPAEHLIR